ncbi:hypothetical protein GGR56DRAFT_205339 [Xylariaceae sp. FL0804]|nr:hypothetical protein GGR56DRAFT_205339 [Xylariaceae sp. FL0804]
MAAGTSLQALSLTYLLMLFAVVGNRASREHRNFGYTTFHHQYGFVAMTQKFKIIVVMTVVACVCLFARAIFQTVFLGCGFESRNPVENVEALYLVFNGFFVAEPVIGLVIAHPSSFLQDGLKQRKRNRLPSSSGLFDNSTESAWNSCQSLRTPSFVPSRPARSTVGSFWEVQSRSSSPHTRGTSNHWIMQSPIRSPQPSRLRYEEAAPPWDDAADFL